MPSELVERAREAVANGAVNRDLLTALAERIRTLEEENGLLRDALRPFADEAKFCKDRSDDGEACRDPACPKPCLYEKARRALYPDTERTPE